MPYVSQWYLELSSACLEIESGFREKKEIEFDDHELVGQIIIIISISSSETSSGVYLVVVKISGIDTVYSLALQSPRCVSQNTT